MDYSIYPQPLVYRTRESLHQFANENKLNEALIDNLLKVSYFNTENFEARALGCFNLAYYICTLLLKDEMPKWHLAKYCKMAAANDFYDPDPDQAVVMSLIKIYTDSFDDAWKEKNEGFINGLVDNLKNWQLSYYGEIASTGSPVTIRKKYYETYIKLIEDIGILRNSVSQANFAPCPIDEDTLKNFDVQTYDWKDLTGTYSDKKKIREIVLQLGKTEKERTLLVNLFKEKAAYHFSGNKEYYETEIKSLLDSILEERGAENESKLPSGDVQCIDKTEDAAAQSLQQQLDEARKKIVELEQKLNLYKNEEQYDKPISVVNKVKMELVLKLMEKDGMTFELNGKAIHGNKTTAARILETITGLPLQTCKNYVTNRDLSYEFHDDDIIRINTWLSALKMSTKI